MMTCNRAPDSGVDLPSQPTISRLENLADAKAHYKFGSRFIDLFLDSCVTPPIAIVLNIEDMADLVHGGRQLALFNTYAGGHGFQPILIFEGNSAKPILSLLQTGKRPSGGEAARVLWHVVHRIRRRWPTVRILIWGDSHCCGPEVLDLQRISKCDYFFNRRRTLTPDRWTKTAYDILARSISKAVFDGLVERYASAAATQLILVNRSPSRSSLRCQPR